MTTENFLILLLSVLLKSCCFDAADDVYVTVNTTFGTLRGKVDSSPNVAITKFFGVPFAKPPLGSLRFKAPEPPLKWDGIKDALDFSSECIQMLLPEYHYNTTTYPPPLSEDCLYLNVYTPTAANTSLPVMVWIHGGGYFIGSGSQYDATSLATKGVVLVTINYRLDAFGFLSTEDEVLPGNYAMIDQIAALKWVKQNIAQFNGDPSRITIFGESAGSTSVSLLILSPLAKGLFQRAIMESGSSLAPWAIAQPGDRVSPRMAARLVSLMSGCNDLDNSTKMLSCLQQADAQTILNAANTVYNTLYTGFIMKPRVETTFGFLPDLPRKLLARGEFNHVDTISGFNSDESATTYASITPNTSRDDAKRFYEEGMKTSLLSFTELDTAKIMKLIETTMISPFSTNEILRREAADAQLDLTMAGPAVLELNYYVGQASEKKHYMYEFNHRAVYKKGFLPLWISAIHGDELPFVFGVDQKEWRFNGQFGPPDVIDTLVSIAMMEMWTGFAKTGDPTSSLSRGTTKWLPYDSLVPRYLIINQNFEQKVWSRPEAVDIFDKVLQIIQGVLPVSDNIVG